MQPEPLSLTRHVAACETSPFLLLFHLLLLLLHAFLFCAALFAHAVPSAVPNGSPAAASLLCNRRL